ncbi:hypothetical protein [Paenibacillus arenilitoris]|uniref:Uncharacterized protein n=1 Tax=Paenibacillus arenilitoris TaxID=2772299 RepID=A0A927CIQ7_9BACL|nr:hypothetical protein [Paenibacillus arenilitoris]MBD2868254.1 hypothetical protein [Paenibacillus arenilitoris]
MDKYPIVHPAKPSDYEAVAKLVTELHARHVAARPDIYAPDPCPLGPAYYSKLLGDPKSKVFVA